MLLTEYLQQIIVIINEFSEAGFILDSNIVTDMRTEKIGSIKGSLTFVDRSRIYFTEYLDLRYRADTLSYSFHYQGETGLLRFRYDNALHKPGLPFRQHKHTPQGIVAADLPEFRQLLAEIAEHISPIALIP